MDQLHSFFSAQSFLGQALGLALFAAYFGAAYFLIFDRAWRTEQRKREQRTRRTDDQDQWQQQEARREQEEAKRWQERQRRQREEDRRQTGGDASRGPPREWWDILGTTPQATMEDVKRAYRDKVRQYHPDKVMGLAPEFIELAEQRTRELNAALEQAKRHVQ